MTAGGRELRLLTSLVGLCVLCITAAGHAQEQDWRSCIVTICSQGECDGPNSNLIVVAPANFADPGYGGEAKMMTQLAALAERLYPAANGWTPQFQCKSKPGESYAMDEAKANIQLAQAPPASHEIKIADPSEVWKYVATSQVAEPKQSAHPGNDKLSGSASDRSSASGKSLEPGEPMNFIMWVDLREPINGQNSLCFHATKTKPAPEGYRGAWPSLKNALPIIKSYFPLMLQECSKRGTPVSANVSFATDDVSPAQKRKTMQEDVERWRKQGFPEVYISN